MNEYTINYDMIIGDDRSPDYIKELASNIKQQGYYPVGDFFKNLYDYEAYELMDYVETSGIFEPDEDDEDFIPQIGAENIVLLGLLLNSGEGGDPITEDSLDRIVRATAGLITITSLHHKGVVECRFENFSVQEDSDKLEVARWGNM